MGEGRPGLAAQRLVIFGALCSRVPPRGVMQAIKHCTAWWRNPLIRPARGRRMCHSSGFMGLIYDSARVNCFCSSLLDMSLRLSLAGDILTIRQTAVARQLVQIHNVRGWTVRPCASLLDPITTPTSLQLFFLESHGSRQLPWLC
jgi:hypothetical protein